LKYFIGNRIGLIGAGTVSQLNQSFKIHERTPSCF
jgi:hypothetical protein